MINPLTGIEEPTPVDPATGLPAEGAPDSLAMPGVGPAALNAVQPGAGAGGAAAPAIPGAPASLIPPQAAHEETVTQTVASPAAKAADAQVAAAGVAQDAARAADTGVKTDQATAEADAATIDRQRAEREAYAKQIQDEAVRKKTAENMAADKAAVAASIAQEKANISPPRVRSALETFSTILATIGQGLSAATEGSKVWEQGNPVAKLYEKQWQDKLAAGLAQFNASERARRLQKEGRDAELQALRHELEIGITNRFLVEKGVEDSWLKERVAKLGPAGQKAAGALLGSSEQLLRAQAAQKSAENYSARSAITNRQQDPSAAAKLSSTEEGAASDIGTAAGLIEDLKKGPKLDQASIDKFTQNKEAVGATSSPEGVTGVIMNRLGRAIGTVPNGAYEGIPPDQQAQISKIDKLRTIQQKLMTGAGVTRPEMATYNEQYGVEFGNTPKVIEQKMAGLVRTLRERTVQAGPAGEGLRQRLDQIEGIQSPRAAVEARLNAKRPASGPKEGERVTFGGKPYVIRGGKAVPEGSPVGP